MWGPNYLKSTARCFVHYVPKHKPPQKNDFERLRDFLQKHHNILVLTGAGISTESGKYFFNVIITSSLIRFKNS